MPDPLLSLRGLQAFEAVTRHRSFARAAAELHVTPGAVSQQIKALEAQIGAPVFERGRELRLTPAAGAVTRQLHAAMEALRGVSRQLRRPSREGALVVTTAPSFASRWLIPRLERFGQRHPECELRLLATTRVIDFGSEDVDAAVRYGSGRYPGLHVERLRGETVIAVAHPRLAAGLGKPADLARATLLHNAGLGWDQSFPDWPTWLQAAGVPTGEALRLREFEEANLVIDAALAGLGAALVSRTLVGEELAAGRLVALFTELPLASAYHFVCPPEHLQRAAVAAFRDWLTHEMRAPAAGSPARVG
jgi:LysR family glycine cleavage system transcriptional activator